MVDLKNRILCGTVLALFAVVSLTSKAGIVVYPEYDARIERDNAYEVRVSQGSEKRQLTVYNHCEKSMLETRTRGGDVNRRFCEFAFDGEPITVEITFCEDVKSYSVFPSRLGLKSDFKDGVLSVTLGKPANFGVRINDYDKTILSVFADAPEDAAKVPRKGDAGVLFVEGWMDPPGEDGVLSVEEPVKEVYIAPGAVLNARLLVKSKGAYVHGRGMMLDPMSDVFRFDQTKNTKRGFFRVNAPDVTVEDVKLVDARTFNFCCWARNATFRNVKALATMMCSDGITCGGQGLRVEGAWLYVGDNALVISGLKDSLLRDIAIGTSCNAIFPQGSNTGVEMENVDVFRADEGLIRNVYNGVLRRNTKWNEMDSGEARKEPGPQDLAHQRQGFFFRNLSAVDCVLFSHFFVGGNMGALSKTFGFENVSVPFPTGKDDWRTIGGKDGVVVNVLHDSAKWLDTTGYELSFTNLWMGGSRLDAIPEKSVKNSDRVAVSVVSTRDTAAIPAIADRHEVNWTCSRKRNMSASPCGENLLADRPSTRSAWQRCPSWLVKFDAMQVEDGERVYRLVQCEKGGGIQNVVTDAFLRRGNGTYRLSFEARAKCDAEVPLQVRFISNEKRVTEKFVIPNDGEWHRFDADVKLDFDLAVTELLSVFLCASAPCDELSFRKLSLVKQAEVVGIPDAPFEMPPIVVPQFAERDFSIADFGAKIGAKATDAFMAAMAACEKAGGGRVVVPEGKWLTGAVHFRNNCNLHLAEGATLEFADDPADYPETFTSWEGVECYNYSPLLYGYGVTNVAITGKGTIAPRMDFWRTWFTRPPEHIKATEHLYHWCSTNAPVEARRLLALDRAHMRPHLIQFNRCANVLLDGFKIRESPFWTVHLYHSENCVVRNLDIYAHGHNNDGVDIEMTRNVLVENCRSDQGDDGIAVKAGRNQDAWRLNRPTENVVVRNCEFVSHNLLAVGSELSGGIRNVWLHHCKMSTPYNLLKVKTNRRRGGFVKNIWFEDVEADNVRDAVVGVKTDAIFQWAQFPDYELRTTEIDGIHVRNVRANCAGCAIDICGDVSSPVKNVVLENVWVGASRKAFERIENVADIRKDNVRQGGLVPKPWVEPYDEVWHRKPAARVREPNYDEAKVAPYTLEDPLAFADGRKLKDASEWPSRRKEILEIFAREMFGVEPPAPEAVVAELREEGPTLAGLAIRRQYRMWFRPDKSGPFIDWLLVLPNRITGEKAKPVDGRIVCENRAKVPVVLMLNFPGNHAVLDDAEVPLTEGGWFRADGDSGDHGPKESNRGVLRRSQLRTTVPAEFIVARGYAFLTACYAQVSPDVEVRKGDPEELAYTHIFELWGKRDESRTDNTTALGAWAWALSRGLDLAETIPEIDAKRCVATGSSRLGKAALLASARDERFAVCVPNQTGGGGVPLAKRDFGENVSTEMASFPHWYCKAYAKYIGNEQAMKFDQHLLVAAIAPRALLVEGFNQGWFDAKGEWLSCRAASPVWEFLGKEGLPKGDFPDNYDRSRIGASFGYVRRGGQHGLSGYDWLWMLDFADKAFSEE